MNRITVVIPIDPDTAPTAERLCDWIYQLSGKITSGHAVLVACGGIHEEFSQKVTIAAELAFESVEVVVEPIIEPGRNPVNSAFLTAAKFIQGNHRWPFLWLEPGSVPFSSDWLNRITESYESQPKRYFGTHMKGPSLFMSRVGVYPPAPLVELGKHLELEAPFELAAAASVIPRCGKTKLIQQGRFDSVEDLSKIRPDAVLVCGDRSGALLEYAMSEITPAAKRVKVKRE